MQILGSTGYTDVVSAASTTAANQYGTITIPQATIAAKNSNVVTSTASSLIIGGPPVGGTNQTITNPYAIFVQSGASRFNGALALAQSSTTSTVSLLAASGVMTNYSLTLPTSTPAVTGQALISDTSGNLSWGSSGAATQNSFTGANNVSSPANITGLVVSNSPTVIPVYVYVNATTKLAAVININAYMNTSGSYSVDGISVGDNTGVTFGITSAGQITYTSANYSGFTSLTFTWFSPYVPVASLTTSLTLSSSLTVGTNANFATNSISGTPSSSIGNLVSVNASIFTDTSTTASGTATAFNATYFGAPTLRAANTAVTTSTASTLTIAGPPIASTNETITNAYSLNVQAGLAYFGGTSLFNNLSVTATQQQYIARFYLTSAWTVPNSTWSYFPSQFAIANDIPPSIRASVSSTNSGATINYNNAGGGLIFLPVSGRYAFNMWVTNVNGTSATTNYELRFYVYSAPAWPAAGSAAKTYGVNQTAPQLVNSMQALLATTAYVSFQENGLSYVGEFPSGTLIAPLAYTSPSLTLGSIYVEARLLNALT